MSTPAGPPTDDRSLSLVEPDLRELLALYLPDGVSADNLEKARADRMALAATLPAPPEDGVRCTSARCLARTADPTCRYWSTSRRRARTDR